VLGPTHVVVPTRVFSSAFGELEASESLELSRARVDPPMCVFAYRVGYALSAGLPEFSNNSLDLLQFIRCTRRFALLKPCSELIECGKRG
jgi:hypothetical protein